jgi:hypothetical protein
MHDPSSTVQWLPGAQSWLLAQVGCGLVSAQPTKTAIAGQAQPSGPPSQAHGVGP